MSLDWFRRPTRWHEHVNRQLYEAPADPWRLVRVDPSSVTHWTTISLRWGLGRVRGGDWDRPDHLDRIAETTTYRGLHQRFVEGREWTETALYERASEAISDGNAVRNRYEDLETYREERLAGLDDLYAAIRDEGYRPNRGTDYETVADAEGIHDLEPIAAIGRGGEVIWTEGYHRLVLAQLLDVEAIPVYVIRRHEAWQARRDRLARADEVEESEETDQADLDHPDLADLV